MCVYDNSGLIATKKKKGKMESIKQNALYSAPESEKKKKRNKENKKKKKHGR